VVAEAVDSHGRLGRLRHPLAPSPVASPEQARAQAPRVPASQRPVAQVLAPALQPADSGRAATLRAATSARTRRSAFLRQAW